MVGLIITIGITLVASITLAILLGKKVKNPKTKRIILIIAPIATILCHYSSIFYHLIGHAISPESITTAEEFFRGNINLLIPIYPCNVVMITCLVIGLTFNENCKFFRALVDFTFLFGFVCALAGLLGNGEYFMPDLPKNYDVYKSAVAHGFLIFNTMLLPSMGYFKLNAVRNVIRVFFMILIMGLVGIYCSALSFFAINKETALDWNAMFLWRTPIDSIPICRFHIVMPLFILALFIVLTLLEMVLLPKEDRWISKLKKTKNIKKVF